MILHHPSTEMLAEYASGALPMSHNLCVATHLEHCPTCQHEYARLNQVGAALFDSLAADSGTPNPDEQALKDRIFQQLDSVAPVAVSAKPASTQNGIPKALRQWIPENYDQLSWFRLTPAFRLVTLLKDRDGAQIALSRVKPGGRMGHHRHTGTELTVVLKGAFSDDSGLYKKGDFVVRDARHRHRPVVTRDAECICLMVTAAPIQFTGRLTRWLNPLLRWQHG
jgi:putative transcriptional regulator